MNIHQTLSQGSGVQLGPVTVSKTYPRKSGDKNRFILVEDASGKAALKIWGAAAGTELTEGQIITLIGTGPRGGVKTSEYQGKVSIDCNDCRLEIGGQAPPQGYSQPQAYNAPQESAPAAAAAYGTTEPAGRPGPAGDKLEATMKRAADATHLYVTALVSRGYTRDEAIMLAQGAGSLFPIWWGGEKFMA